MSNRKSGRPKKKLTRSVQICLKVTKPERKEWDDYHRKSGKPGPDALMDAIRNPVAPKP